MNTYIGIDLGTSGVKVLLVGADGKILNEVSEDYDVLYPQAGWTEQRPQDWQDAVMRALRRLLADQNKSAVKGISFGGQMHGLVVLDEKGQVIRPCILWNDGRTEKETDYLNERIGRDKLSDYTGNVAFAGFTAPKLFWLKEHEPDNFRRIAKIMLPKDYIAYILTGNHCTDYSDASGTLLLDVQHKCWSKEMCRLCGVTEEQLPTLYESYEAVGTLKADIANELRLREDVRVVAGAGDNAAAAVGTGTVGEGACNVSLGTSGTIFLSTDRFTIDANNALHSFCHADGKWHLMGCILSAASARKWWLEDILGSTDYVGDEEAIAKVDTDGLYFLPYLSGERSPHNDVNARGAFIGLSATTTKAQMSRVVMEGVAFALRDCLEVAKQNGVPIAATNLCGGGARSAVWRQIIADVLNLPVNILATEQGPAFGAAILAMVGCGEYLSVRNATEKIVRVKATIYPKNAELYEKKYNVFKQLYPALSKISL